MERGVEWRYQSVAIQTFHSRVHGYSDGYMFFLTFISDLTRDIGYSDVVSLKMG